MLPVSGAEQLKGSAPIGERPMISHSEAYSRLESASLLCFFGAQRFHKPALRALALSSAITGGSSQRSPLSIWRANTGSAGRMCSSRNAVMRLARSAVRGVGGGSMRFSSAGAGQNIEVMRGVAEVRGDRGDALEIMADSVLHRHADAAVKLRGLLADQPAGIADLHLGGRDRLPSRGRGVVLGGDGGEHR